MQQPGLQQTAGLSVLLENSMEKVHDHHHEKFGFARKNEFFLGQWCHGLNRGKKIPPERRGFLEKTRGGGLSFCALPKSFAFLAIFVIEKNSWLLHSAQAVTRKPMTQIQHVIKSRQPVGRGNDPDKLSEPRPLCPLTTFQIESSKTGPTP